MGTLLSRSSSVVVGMCVAAALSLAALSGIASVSLNSAADEAEAINSNEVATATLAARFALAVDRAFVTGRTQALLEPTSELTGQLFQTQIPRVEELLGEMRQIRTDDAGARRSINRLIGGWTQMRALLTDPRLMLPGNAQLAERLRRVYEDFNENAEGLVEGQAAKAGARNDATSKAVASARQRIFAAAAAALVLLAGLGVLGNRRIRREVEPAKEQAEFADTLQLTETEAGAHSLLQRRLLRVVPASTVSVLNRNNSANRLEPMTDVSAIDGLTERLVHSEPRSCIAIRSARVHDEDPRHPGLIACDVCSPCEGMSSCTPLTVSGEVIGSVLVSGPRRPDDRQRRLIRDCVAAAAPVLANLRNLSLAQLHAATDSLTGLPNKRAVADNLKRMFAQASRTSSPMAVILLDLDHFKVVNDRFGHPVGDLALASVGAVMRSTLRDSDFAGRNGGEEFAVVLPNTDTAGAVAAAEKLRTAIAEVSVPGLDLELTASLGVAVYPQHALSPERLERLADAALYVAKASGRNRVEVAKGQARADNHEPASKVALAGAPTASSQAAPKGTATRA